MNKVLQYLSFVIFFFGSLSVQSQTKFKAILSGVNETPPALSSAFGTITGELNGNVLTISGSFDNLTTTYTASHIHLAIAGTKGPVVFNLVPDLNSNKLGGSYTTSSNTFTLSANQITLLEGRQLYINVHSKKYPAGEIRGQLVPESEAYYSINLFGSNEVPNVITPGWGNIIGELNGNSLTLSGSFTSLESNFNGGAHIHSGMAGESGGILQNLTVVAGTDNKSGTLAAANNTFTLTANELASLNGRGLYINIHSVDHPTGDIRGQILPISAAVFNVNLEGEQENPPINTTGQGRLVVELLNNQVTVSGSFSQLESNFNGDAIIGISRAGTNGGVLFPLNVSLNPNNVSGKLAASDNKFSVTDEETIPFLRRGYYVNINSVLNPSGELRGQILPLANSYFFSRFSGYNEVNPVTVQDNGGIAGEWLQDSLTISGTFNNLLSKYNRSVGSHIHQAPPAQNGPIIFNLTPFFVVEDSLSGLYAADSNRFGLTEAQKTTLISQDFYANIHTQDHPSGETRGQIMNVPNSFPQASSIISPADGASITLEGLSTDPFTFDFADATDPKNDKVFYVWQLSLNQILTNVLITANTGTTSQFVTTVGALDNLLANAGIALGSSVILHQRVITSDGSLLNFSDTASVTIKRGSVTIASIKNSLSSNVEIFPNPVQQTLIVNFTNSFNSKMEIQIVDIKGKVAYRTSGVRGDKLEIQLSDFVPGTYFINIISDGSLISTEKIIKE